MDWKWYGKMHVYKVFGVTNKKTKMHVRCLMKSQCAGITHFSIYAF